MADFLFKLADLITYPMVALLLSGVFTVFAIIVLPRLGFIDMPGGRHIHRTPVPRGGGIAVIAAFFLSYGLYAVATNDSAAKTLFMRLFLPSVILGLLGLLDDRFNLKAWVKLLVQIIVSVIVWLAIDKTFVIFGLVMPCYVSLILTIGWIVVLINAFNLIDGLDGLASGLALISACCMTAWFLISGHRQEAVAAMTLAAACLAFLRYNFSPAKIFLGDTGSTFLGLFFAVIGLSTLDRVVTVTSLLLPILATGVPIFDVILAIWRRSIRKALNPESRGIMSGDQDHLHHRLLRIMKNEKNVAFSLYLLACLFAVGALCLFLFRNTAPLVVFIVILIMVLVAIRQLAVVELSDSAQIISNGFGKPRKGVLSNVVHPFIDFLGIIVSYTFASILTGVEPDNLNLFACAVAPPMLFLCSGNAYKVYWLRAGLNNYWHLAMLVFTGSAAGCLSTFFLYYKAVGDTLQISSRSFLCGCVLFILMNLFIIILERFIVHYAEGFWFRELWLQANQSSGLRRVLVYGAGVKCRLYVKNLYSSQKCIIREEVVGILDDDNGLHRLIVNGFPVLGSAVNLESVFKSHPFEKIVITSSDIERDTLQKLKRFCRGHRIELCRFDLREIEILKKTDFEEENC